MLFGRRRLLLALTALLLAAGGPGLGVAADPTDPADPAQELLRLRGRLNQELLAGDLEGAMEVCREQARLEPREPVHPYNLGCLQARLGRGEEALASLDRALDLGLPHPGMLRWDEDLVSLHEDPRFADLLARARKAELEGDWERGERLSGVRTVEAFPEEGFRYRLRHGRKASRKRPDRLIVWLHPGGASANRFAERLAPRLARRGFALLVLTQKDFSGWTRTDLRRLLEGTLPEVDALPQIDAERPVLLGHSAGARAAFWLWYEDPERFRGIVATGMAPTSADPRHRGKRPLLEPDPGREELRRVPLLVLVGSADPYAAPWRQGVEAWQEAGVPLTLRWIEGKGHVWLWDEKETARLMDWLDELDPD
jgi:pimeloyl-ACP methyl ester carboxylesterase